MKNRLDSFCFFRHSSWMETKFHLLMIEENYMEDCLCDTEQEGEYESKENYSFLEHGPCSVQVLVPGGKYRSWICQIMLEVLSLSLRDISQYCWQKEGGNPTRNLEWGNNYSHNSVSGSSCDSTAMSHFFLRVVVK